MLPIGDEIRPPTQKQLYTNAFMYLKKQRYSIIILYCDRSIECIRFTMICNFYFVFWSTRFASIIDIESGGFCKYLLQILLVLCEELSKNLTKSSGKREFLFEIGFGFNLEINNCRELKIFSSNTNIIPIS